ncbi:hypothetical protein [Pedobacter duraquae]|uniref:hypothetical protein n=1 Tax=Pedobacter duraquae TaxID=425511 RepID=UPI00105C28A2|nr:hypothetical protein [Pedobacter duraquae]
MKKNLYLGLALALLALGGATLNVSKLEAKSNSSQPGKPNPSTIPCNTWYYDSNGGAHKSPPCD